MPQNPQEKSPHSHLTAKILDFIDIHPSQIQHLHYAPESGYLYIARKNYSEVYSVTIGENASAKDVTVEQVMVLEPCERIYEIGRAVVLVCAFEVKVLVDGRQSVHPFTTQLVTLATRYDPKSAKLYTFHAS